MTAEQLLDLRVEGGSVTEAGHPGERPGRARLPRRVAARDRRRGDRQPHGGRGDRRDRPLAALAVAARAVCCPTEQYAAIRDEELARLGGAARAASATPGTCSIDLVLDDDFAEFLTLRAYTLLG